MFIEFTPQFRIRDMRDGTFNVEKSLLFGGWIMTHTCVSLSDAEKCVEDQIDKLPRIVRTYPNVAA